MPNNDFFTFREYMKKEDDNLTACMEDYVEMIFRLSQNSGYTRVHELASSLNIQPPSATKMVQKLSELGLLKYEKYGTIELTNKGEQIGKALLERHNIIQDFLSIIGIDKNLLDETEKIEHTINANTLKHLKIFIGFLKLNTDFLDKYKTYYKTNGER